MALYVKHAMQDGAPEWEFFARATVKTLQKTRAVTDIVAHEDDRRSVAKLDLFWNEEQANQPERTPVKSLFVPFDFDLGSPLNALAQAYEAAKADPRFAGARDA